MCMPNPRSNIPGSVTLGKDPICEPRVPHLENGDNSHITGLLEVVLVVVG